jgi:anti-sigma factor RsiW
MRNLRSKFEREEKDEKIIYLTKARIMRGKLAEQDLTDYALNELNDVDRLYVESMLAASEECRNDIVATIEMAQCLEEGFERELVFAERQDLALRNEQRLELVKPHFTLR